MTHATGTKKKNIWKTVAASTMVIGLCSGVFVGANNVAMALAFDKEESIPTAYNVKATSIDKSTDYVKADYNVLGNKVMSSKNIGELPIDQAAEIGAQYLWDMFQVDLNGKTIYMSYFVDPSNAKAYWTGDIIETGSDISSEPPTYSFVIEAISGTRVSVSKQFDKKETAVPFNPQKAIEQYKNNCDEYLELAKQFTEKHSGIKAIAAEFKDISASLDGSSIDYGKPISDAGDIGRAYEIFVVITVTDEQGGQTEVTISTDNKNLQSLHTIDPNVKNDPNHVG